MPEPIDGHREPNAATVRSALRGPGARPRVLFLACHLPWPPVSGGRRRELELLRRVGERFDVQLVVVSKTPEQDRANAERLGCCRSVEVFAAEAQVQDDGHPDQVLRHRSAAARARVARLLAAREVDLVHVEGFYLMQHLPERPGVPVLLVEQNVEYELERQRATAAGDLDTTLSARSRMRRTRAAEFACWGAASAVATVTAEDRDAVRAALPGREVAVVPDGADHLPAPGDASGPDVGRPDGPLVMLLANFAYAPNVDAAQYLCRDIVTALAARVPDVHVWLVGNAPPAEVQALASERIRVTGYVPDVVPYLDAADVVVCPLRIGGGIKVKMLEALRRGKAIVSTSIGAQGFPAQARCAVLVADETDAFAGATARLLLDREQRTWLERAAARAALRLPTWDESATSLQALYDQLLAGASAGAEPLHALAGRSA